MLVASWIAVISFPGLNPGSKEKGPKRPTALMVHQGRDLPFALSLFPPNFFILKYFFEWDKHSLRKIFLSLSLSLSSFLILIIFSEKT